MPPEPRHAAAPKPPHCRPGIAAAVPRGHGLPVADSYTSRQTPATDSTNARRGCDRNYARVGGYFAMVQRITGCCHTPTHCARMQDDTHRSGGTHDTRAHLTASR